MLNQIQSKIRNVTPYGMDVGVRIEVVYPTKFGSLTIVSEDDTFVLRWSDAGQDTVVEWNGVLSKGEITMVTKGGDDHEWITHSTCDRIKYDAHKLDKPKVLVNATVQSIRK